MNFPVTAPFSDTGEHHGIINKLTKTFNIDVLNEKYVSLDSSPKYTGEITALVNHGTGHHQSKSDGISTYMQISFNKGYIFPTGYTLKGPSSGAFGYSKSWYVYGIHEGDQSDNEKWELLGENDTTQSTYCKTLRYDGECQDNRVGSFSLKQMKTLIGFKALRWVTKEGCCNSNIFFSEGIDIYGTLSLIKSFKRTMKSLCHCRNNHNYLIIIILFCNIIHS